MKFKLIKENIHEIYGMLYGLISLIFMYVIFVAGVLGLIFFALWNLGIAPVLGIAKIDILSSSLATLSIFSTFCFFHIDILKDNERRYNTLRYLKYNLWLNIILKIFLYLFASIPFIILWNYAIPNIFVLNLPKINFL
ncbi:MAG: hypothetical protein E7311_00075 [Clostridiales bacterium]|nr:hypothetical protein [Clostridiales bacterium]